MDRKTLALFVACSAAILIGWYVVIIRPEQRRQAALKAGARPPAEQPAPARPEPPAKDASQQAQEQTPAGGGEEKAPAEPGKEAPAKTEPPKPEAQYPIRSDITLSNDLIESVWTNVGAGLVRATFVAKYKAPFKVNGKRPDFTLLHEFAPGFDSLVVSSVDLYEGGEAAEPRHVALDQAVYKVTEEGEGKLKRLVFEYALPEGLVLEKIVSLPPGLYNFDVRIRLKNRGTAPLGVAYALRTAAGIAPETAPPNSVGPVFGTRKENGSFSITAKGASSVAKQPYENNSVGLRWAGMQNRYFVAVLLTEQDLWRGATASLVVDQDMAAGRGRWASELSRRLLQDPEERARLARSNAETTVLAAKLTLPAGGAPADHAYRFIVAPKADAVLAPYEARIEDLQQFTWFKGISRFILRLLKAIHAFIPNYGVAIILLTLLVKLALHPLTKKSQISLVRMQQLQPELQKLKEKFGHDKQKLGAEQWSLYRKYGISPLSGCWPVFFQMPIFIALFGALRAAIELRQAGFLWIDDLSQPDTVARLPFDIPLLGTDGINILPFLMLISSVLSQQLQPKAVEAQARQQQQMMKFMSIFFAFILYKMPSGLLLYWTSSTTIGIVEQWLIRRKVEKVKAQALVPASEKKQPKHGSRHMKSLEGEEKPGWFGRLQTVIDDQAKKAEQLTGTKEKGGKKRRKDRKGK